MLRERWHNVALTLVNYARVKDIYSNQKREHSFQLKKKDRASSNSNKKYENENINRYSKYFE